MEFGSLEQTSPHICCPPCNWWRARLLKVTLVVWVLVHTEIKKRAQIEAPVEPWSERISVLSKPSSFSSGCCFFGSLLLKIVENKPPYKRKKIQCRRKTKEIS